jgi:hypothetical protein
MSAARAARRRTARAQRKAARHAPDRALQAALRIANMIGPHVARRFAGLIGIRPGDPCEVFAFDRETGALRCWACGDELGDVIGMSVVNGQAIARDPEAPMVMVRQCESCAAEVAPLRKASA